MVYRLKFRIRGGQAPGKYVFTLEEGIELFLDENFHPSLEHRDESWLFLEVREGKTLMIFLKADLTWNGKKPPKGPVEIRPGHLIGRTSHMVEILECPEPVEEKTRERTQFLDITSLRHEEPEEATAPAPHFEASPEIVVPEEPVLTETSEPLELAKPCFAETSAEALEPAPLPEIVIAPVEATKPPSSGNRVVEEASPPPPQTFQVPRFTASPLTQKAEQEFHQVVRPVPGKEASAPSTPADIFVHENKVRFSSPLAIAIAIALTTVTIGRVTYRRNHVIPVEQETITEPADAPVAVSPPTSDPVASTSPAPEELPPTVTPITPPPAPLPPVQKSLAITPHNETAPPIEGSTADKANVENLLRAIEEGDVAGVKAAVETNGVSQDFSHDSLGRSPLVRAAAFGRLTILRFLLEKKADLHALDYGGNDALMWAVINGHEKTTTFLLSQGMSPKRKREDGSDAVKLAKEYKQKNIEKLLLAELKNEKNLRTKRSPASQR